MGYDDDECLLCFLLCGAERPLKFGEFLGGHVCSGHVNIFFKSNHMFLYKGMNNVFDF